MCMEQLTMLPYVQATDNALIVAFVTDLEAEHRLESEILRKVWVT
jgi:hypothetical protein